MRCQASFDATGRAICHRPKVFIEGVRRPIVGEKFVRPRRALEFGLERLDVRSGNQPVECTEMRKQWSLDIPGTIRAATQVSDLKCSHNELSRNN